MRMPVFRKSLMAMAAGALFFSFTEVPAFAAFSIPGFELVHTIPAKTDLKPLGVRAPATVWCQMFDAAKHEIDIEQFYAFGHKGSKLDKVIRHLTAAANRGVKVRFLMEKKGVGFSDQETIERLKKIPHAEFRQIAWADVEGSGIIHAKFFIVDKRAAYVGSQNFDWRALEHIDETGLRITDKKIVAQVQSVFDRDWAAEALIAAGKKPAKNTAPDTKFSETAKAQLVASPADFNPQGIAHSEAALVDLLAHAKHDVMIEVMDYSPLFYHAGYYPAIDNALRDAAHRGVKVRLMVANWSLRPFKTPYLKSLQVLPNIEVKVVTFPQIPGHFIPFARVLHSKTMTIDGEVAWIGTSNWEGGYFTSLRNLEVVLRSPEMAAKLGALQSQLWHSKYAAPLDINKVYPKPHPATEKAPQK